MRIDDIVNITDAELINAGYISDVLAFADELNKVKREFLFISNDTKDIKEAINKGAYAILFSEDLEVIDDEIAWLKVSDISESLLKLLKYKLLNTTLYTTDEITLQIIKSINKDKKLAVIDRIDVKFLNDEFVFITSIDRIKNISINHKELINKIELKFVNETIFVSEFILKDKKYSILFPSLYKNNLQKAVAFFEELELTYHLKNIKIDRFNPQFINKKYEKVDYGKTEKVVVQGIKKDKYFIDELNYIFEKIKYANVRFYDRNNINYFYKEKFNFAILIDCKVQLKEKIEDESSLF